jgi:hypothetical protein
MHPAITALIKSMIGRFGGYLSSGFRTSEPEGHPDYHNYGLAGDYVPDNWGGATAYSNQIGTKLLEGIHASPPASNVSWKDGAQVDPSFWGAATWAQHHNHIHLAIDSMVKGAIGAATAAFKKLVPATITGPDGQLKTLLQDRSNVETAVANAFLAKHAPQMSATAEGDVPYVSGGGGSVVKQIGSILLKNGLNKIGAAGIIGNAYGESNWIPSATDGAGNGGLWGFTASPVSLPDLQSFASREHKPWTDVGVQTQFLLDHLSASHIGFDRGFANQLNNAGSPSAAALYFEENWEHPQSVSGSAAKREGAAEQAFKMGYTRGGFVDLWGKGLAHLAGGGSAKTGSGNGGHKGHHHHHKPHKPTIDVPGHTDDESVPIKMIHELLSDKHVHLSGAAQNELQNLLQFFQGHPAIDKAIDRTKKARDDFKHWDVAEHDLGRVLKYLRHVRSQQVGVPKPPKTLPERILAKLLGNKHLTGRAKGELHGLLGFLNGDASTKQKISRTKKVRADFSHWGEGKAELRKVLEYYEAKEHRATRHRHRRHQRLGDLKLDGIPQGILDRNAKMGRKVKTLSDAYDVAEALAQSSAGPGGSDETTDELSGLIGAQGSLLSELDRRRAFLEHKVLPALHHHLPEIEAELRKARPKGSKTHWELPALQKNKKRTMDAIKAAHGDVTDLAGPPIATSLIFEAQLKLSDLQTQAAGSEQTGISISDLEAFADAVRYGAFTTLPYGSEQSTAEAMLAALPAHHQGGIVDGPAGTREVLRRLEVGEGVIDADTMRSGLPAGGGPYEFVVTNWEEGTGYFRSVADKQVAKRDRATGNRYRAGQRSR